ncbi:MAG TPA: FtsX-like permease family protein [Actinomycetes bacterium]
MFVVTLRGIVAHRIRLLLSASAVALGISFLAGTMVLTDTIGHSVDQLEDSLATGSDVSVRSASVSGGDVADRAPVPASALAAVRDLPGVASATGSSVGFAQLVAPDGDLVGTGAPVGISMPPGGLLQVRTGHAPAGPDQVALDVDTAKRSGLKVGDTVSLLLAGPTRTATLVGLVSYGEVTAIPGASVVAFDPDVADQLVGTPGHFTTLEVTAEDGVAPDQLRRSVAATLPDGLEAVTGEQAADESIAAVRKAVRFIPMALMAFVAVSLFVAAFLIVNTFSMLVSQRSREFGLLRAVGATSRQVFAIVVGEAIAVGLLASAAGLGLGIGAAHALHALLPALGIALPDAAIQVRGTVAVVSLATGTLVTLLAALVPAARAGRVPPVVAILGLSTGTKAGSRLVAALGGALAATGAALVTSGLTAGDTSGLQRLGLGALAAFLGLGLLARHLVRPMVAVVGRPWTRFLGVPGRLGSDHATRNPQRTVMTAAALTVGLALVSLTSVFSASASASLGRALDEGQRADYLVSSSTFGEYSTEVTAALAARPEFDDVVGLRSGSARVAGSSADLVAGDPATLERVVDLDVQKGSVGRLGHGGVLVHRDVAAEHQWRVGDQVAMTFDRAGAQQPTVVGTFAEKRLLGTDYVIGLADHEAWFGPGLDRLTLVGLADGVGPREASAAFDVALADHPELEARTGEESKADQQRQLDEVLALVTGMLGLALLIALLGIVNTLALAVHERTSEIGLLRAVGMSRRQLRRTVRYEAVQISLMGALAGVLLGVAAAAGLVHVLREQGLTDLSVPLVQLLGYLALAAAAGVLAAAWPARRATSMDILGAIAHD